MLYPSLNILTFLAKYWLAIYEGVIAKCLILFHWFTCLYLCHYHPVRVLHSICQQIWKTQQWSQDRKTSVFIPIPKKGNAKECSYNCTIALISCASKEMLKIIQARLQEYLNWELSDFQAGFRKGRGNRDQIAKIQWIMEKAWEFHKNIYSALLITLKPLTVWITINCGKFLKEMGIRHLTCCLRNLYADQEKTVRTGHRTMDWFQIGKGVCQGCILSPCRVHDEKCRAG